MFLFPPPVLFCHTPSVSCFHAACRLKLTGYSGSSMQIGKKPWRQKMHLVRLSRSQWPWYPVWQSLTCSQTFPVALSVTVVTMAQLLRWGLPLEAGRPWGHEVGHDDDQYTHHTCISRHDSPRTVDHTRKTEELHILASHSEEQVHHRIFFLKERNHAALKVELLAMRTHLFLGRL